MYTKIKAKKDLYNFGKCFTKGKVYELTTPVVNSAGLMEKLVTNDQNQPHIIGGFWRNFELLP